MSDLEYKLDLQHPDDETIRPAAHNKLLGAVSQLYEKKRVKASTRKEPSLEVSEFHLSQPGKKRSSHVKVTDLAKALKKRSVHTEISQKLKTARKRAKTLSKPLEKIHSDKITRVAGYEHAKRQLNRWDAIVYKQRVAEQVKFPLTTETVKVYDTTDISKMFRKPTELELKMAELLNEPKSSTEKGEEDQQNENEEQEENYPLTLQEVIEKRKIMAKLRAQQSYKQTKAARHSKIKSKKFHQIQRRSRVKEQLKQFEELQKTDPEAALKKLEELERTRAEERVTLRHRSTGQWAKNLAVRAKYNKEARIALSEQLSKSRELTVKLVLDKDSESEKEEEEEVQPEQSAEEDPNNPWVMKRSKEMEEFVSGYREYWEKKGKEMEMTENNTAVKTHNSESMAVDAEVDGKESCAKENTQPKSNSEANEEPTEKESRKRNITDNYEVSTPKKIKSFLSKNVFNINDASMKFDLKRVSKKSSFHVSNVTMDEKRINTVSTVSKSQKSKNTPKESKLTGKTGSWSVTNSIGTNAAQSFKKSKNVSKTFQSKKVNVVNHSFNITDNKNPVKSVRFKNEEVVGNGKGRVLKEKSLDELFEEAEDKIQNRLETKLNKMKESVNKVNSNKIESHFEPKIENTPSLELKRTMISADVDEELIEESEKKKGGEMVSNVVKKTLATALTEVKQSNDIDPTKFITVTPRHLSSQLPEIMTQGEDALDDEETSAQERHLTISEAFAEDDVVDQFQKEKDEEIKKTQVGDLDLTLPGWGSWAGHNMKSAFRRKRKKFVIKFPKAIPRRDTNRGNVIINEDADKSIKVHQVSEIPFPFTSVKEYEASIRAPLGSTWVPQKAYQKMILPPVITQLGAVIQPMDESQLVKKEKMATLKKRSKINKLKIKGNKK